MAGGHDEKRPFAAMLKPVGPKCNLACKYCYYTPHESAYTSGHSFRMEERVLELAIRSVISLSPGPLVPFTWHGGEPALAGIPFFEKALALERAYLPQGWEAVNNLQTNGTLLDDAWCDFLASERFDVGISVDGNKYLHDENRLDHAGNGTYKKVAAAVRRLQSHGIQPDLLCTVTSSIAAKPLAAYQSLKSFGALWLQFIPIVRFDETGRLTPDSVSGQAYGAFLCRIFDEWATRDIGKLDVQIFAEMSLASLGMEPSVCQYSPTCGRAIVIEHDGEVYSCDHFADSAHSLGNLQNMALEDMLNGPMQTSFGEAKASLLSDECLSCEYLSLCRGGCPKDRLGWEKGEKAQYVLCDGVKAFLGHARSLLGPILQSRLQGKAPADVIAMAKAELA